MMHSFIAFMKAEMNPGCSTLINTIVRAPFLPSRLYLDSEQDLTGVQLCNLRNGNREFIGTNPVPCRPFQTLNQLPSGEKRFGEEISMGLVEPGDTITVGFHNRTSVPVCIWPVFCGEIPGHDLPSLGPKSRSDTDDEVLIIFRRELEQHVEALVTERTKIRFEELLLSRGALG